jgi:EAL domain-containing protein (putative c-di-GMP-specific phosphodiesterase class I)
MVQDSGFAGATLEKLRNLGVRIDIDDFGTGYSSFERLKDMPINTLKIDRSFVAKLGEDPRDEQTVQTIINLASGLRMSWQRGSRPPNRRHG